MQTAKCTGIVRDAVRQSQSSTPRLGRMVPAVSASVFSLFIPPMLCERLTNVSRLADRSYIAEPKLDGQRARVESGCAGLGGLLGCDAERDAAAPFVSPLVLYR